jgi:SAM-dependent methyltransferase
MRRACRPITCCQLDAGIPKKGHAMTIDCHIHLCIMQPGEYVHSLGFLDQARYFRHQFRRMGATVSLSKNRLMHGAINFVFGAHLGFDPALRQRYSCVFVNLEQLGQGGAKVSPAYLQLLSTSAVVDYDASNLAAYTQHPDDVPIVPLMFAPYLKPAQSLPLAERPIDLLFIGSMNERRRALLDRIEAQGITVSLFDGPLYGPERDQYIMQAKAVFNAHFYESARFEQARVSHCLSLGTPVISERTLHTQPHAAFEDAVFWLTDEQIESFFAEQFATPAFYEQAQAALTRFEQTDPINDYADLLAFAIGFAREHQARRPQGPWQPTRLRLGSGQSYRPGWLNIDTQASEQPDWVLDLGQPIDWPLEAESAYAGPVRLEAGTVQLICGNNLIEKVVDLPALMGNCLQLLQTGGKLMLETPYERATAAWQDPRHLRALNEKSWLYYTEWFWRLGWFEHRFAICEFIYLDENMCVCEQAQAAFMRVLFEKVETNPQERTLARVMRADFALEDDQVTYAA